MITKTELIRDLRSTSKRIGKIPTIREYDNVGEYNYVTYIRVFGSWNKALLSAFNKINQKEHEISRKMLCKQCSKEIIRMEYQISQSLSGNCFCSKSCSATYNNAHKKYGCRRSKLEKWIEEQLQKKYTTLDIHFNRKDAINSELDIYIPSLKLAFELNGIYHYEPIHGADKLASVKNNDQRKFQACLERGIELCIIDVSGIKHFKENKAQKILDIIVDVIDQCDDSSVS